MIKSLLDADENPPPETKVIIEETVVAPHAAQTADAEDILEIYTSAAGVNSNETPQNTGAASYNDADFQTFGETAKFDDVNFISSAKADKTAQPNSEPPLFQTAYEPETTAETMRKSGLAYAAAITLFGAVVFMMILGWGADLLFGSSPWGIVGGIVLGAVIGFVQFFRLTSQIIKNKE